MLSLLASIHITKLHLDKNNLQVCDYIKSFRFSKSEKDKKIRKSMVAFS